MTNETEAVDIRVQGEVRMLRPGRAAGPWKRITSLSENFVCLNATAPASRRSLELMIAQGRVEYRPADWASL